MLLELLHRSNPMDINGWLRGCPNGVPAVVEKLV